MSDPKRFGEAAQAFVGKNAAGGALLAAAALEAWNEVAGPDIARHTEGVRFKKGELLVHVDLPAWANELQLMGEEMRQRINARLGKESVTSLRFTVSKRVGDRNRRKSAEEETDRLYERARESLGALSAEDMEAVAKAAGGVPDDEIRDALRRAMEASLRIRRASGKTRR